MHGVDSVRVASGGTSDAIVRVNGLTKRYGRTVALDGVDLEIRPNELFALLGPNGAGKTTLIHILCTILAPDTGTVTLAGFDVVRQPRKARQRGSYVAHINHTQRSPGRNARANQEERSAQIRQVLDPGQAKKSDEFVKQVFRDVKIVTLPGLGHMMHHEDPESVARHIVEFEREQAAAAP